MLIALLASLAVGYVIASRIAGPIGQLAAYARELAKRDFRSASDSIADRLSARGDEVGKLAEAFSSMQRTLQTYLSHLTETTAAKERIESELRIARELQMSLLPRRLAEAPGGSRFAIYGCLDPSREVGGDFYDYFFNGDGRLCLVIGDVSEKGLPASLFMAVSRTLIRATTLLTGSLNSRSPDAVLASVNAELQRDNEHRMFATVFFAIVDLESGEMEYSNAGHNPPFVLSTRGNARPLDDLRARPLGIKKNAGYSKSAVRLAPGDILFLYTDGITEMEDPDGRAFGEARLRYCLEKAREESPESLTGRVLAEVNGFRGSNTQRDDVTAVALRYDGPATEVQPKGRIGAAG
jgi:sigma-B regulation protein RsbU (phosphoserine phosphatase)